MGAPTFMAFQVCDGAKAAETCSPECGNNICEDSEGPWGLTASSCAQDCPIAVNPCPRGADPSLGGALSSCGGRGACLIGTAACNCYQGYAGEPIRSLEL
eukprot:scaffold5262_cov46-Prasinocladus_malaysianus.AAC.2